MDFTRKSYVGHLHILFTLQVAQFCVVWAVGIGDFFYLESLKTDIMNSSKRQTTPLSISRVSPQSLFDGVRLRLENFSRIQWAIFVASPSEGFEPCVSLVGGMTQVTAALMR